MVKNYQGNAYDPHPKHPSARGGASSTMSVILYQPLSEAAPLLPGNTERREMSMSRLRRVGGWGLALFVFSLLVYQTSVHSMLCPPDPSTRDTIRRDWEKEEAQHATLERDWQHKKEAQNEIEQDWKRAAERHKSEVARRIHEEHVRQERVRQEWMREIEQHAREFEEMQRREREERERERMRWQREVEEWEREVEERERREEEERQKLNMFWGGIEAHTCTTYATREYTAQLMNLPTTWKRRVEACKATPLEIHGISYLPKTCEERRPGVVIGRWEINQQEPDCTTFWDSYSDKGCTSPGSGKKYITHKLENLPNKSDWREFCATTPVRFDHIQFPGAQECFQAVWGVYGQWEMDDSNC